MDTIAFLILAILLYSKYKQAGQKGCARYNLMMAACVMGFNAAGGLLAGASGQYWLVFLLQVPSLWLVILLYRAGVKRLEARRVAGPAPPVYVHPAGQPQQAAPQAAAPAAQSGTFYCFVVQAQPLNGPGLAFGPGVTQGGVQQSACEMAARYAPAAAMGLQTVQPQQWGGRVDVEEKDGMITCRFGLEDNAAAIRSYLTQQAGASPAAADAGLAVARSINLKVANPAAGYFMIGVPVQG